jgi:hypothetical protein
MPSEEGPSGGRDRRRSGDLTLFSSDLAIFANSQSTWEIPYKCCSWHINEDCIRSHWTAMIHPVSHSLGHAQGTKLELAQLFWSVGSVVVSTSEQEPARRRGERR